MLYRQIAAFGIVVFLSLPLNAHAGVRVDINQDNGRGDVLAPGWTSWRVQEKESATARFGDVTITLRAVGTKGKLATGWWKPGFDYPARMASDGVVSDKLELVLRGLTGGKHSLATYHNALTEAKPDRITVTVLGGASVTVTPSSRVKHDADAASAYVEFTAESGKDVVVLFTPDVGGSVTLNGFELDRADPSRRAARPEPFDGDEHAPENPLLAWKQPAGATAYHVYLGTNAEKVAGASRESPEFCGETRDVKFPADNLKLDHRQTYYWRVDTVHPNSVVRGELWSFRVRHLAFPEAEGYGRFAIGGRAGKVYAVTSLNDSGPGTLREAVEASGPRTVVFRVGGTISLKSRLIIRNPYLTIAGQTAPGDGICVKNYTFGCSDTHDVIIRHLRIRIGDESGLTQDGSGARGSDHVIFDHCSISWSIDEGFSSREGGNLTVQRCIIAEALNIADHRKYKPGTGHSFAGSISGNIGSFHHNLLVNCAGRNWSLAGGLDRTGARLAGRLDIRNNVVYNWSHRTTDGGVRELNFVNNYYRPGPASKNFTLLKPDPGDPDRGMRAFMEGNVIEGKTDLDKDNWKAYVGPAAGMAKVKVDRPIFEPFVKTHSAKDAYMSVLTDVGATRPKQDSIDRRVIDEVKKRENTFAGSKGKLPGIIDTPKDVGGWPEYKSGNAPADADGDGIPDDREKAIGLDPGNAADGAMYRSDGFTNLEHYLNSLAFPTRERPSADPKYRATINQRASAAVSAAKVTDAANKAAAIRIVEEHYFGIYDIHHERDEAVKEAANDKTAIAAARSKSDAAVADVHERFTGDLSALLAPEQCDVIKDKMTYDVRLNNFRMYCEMLPKLTAQEKAKISELLVAGREDALVAGSADAKHEKFRLARGRINNYLSAQGYDVRKASEEWAAKQKSKSPKMP